jgi:hypothetical protein
MIRVLGVNLVKVVGCAGIAMLVACGGSDSGGGSLPPPPVVGKRVVFTANTFDESLLNELWVTHTNGTANTPTRVAHFPGISVRLDQPFVAPGGAYYGARRAAYGNAVTGCPASMHIFATANSTVNTDYPIGGSACLHELGFNAAGNALAMRFSFAGASGANLATTTVSAFPNTIYTVDTNALVQTGGTVQQFKYSPDGNYPVWTEATGLYSTLGSGAGGTANLRSADTPAAFEVGQIAGVPYAVYIAPGETRFRITNLVPLAAQSQSYLTNALAGGDTLGAWKLSPDGAHLLYEAQVSGAWQLRLVSLTAPLAEQRVDGSAPLIASSIGNTAGSSETVFAFNTDGTRFAWSGDVGGSSVRLNSATVAAPTIGTVLTPADQGLFYYLDWSDPTTLVYAEWNFGMPGPLRPVGLFTVSVNSPQITAPLYNASVPDSSHYLGTFDICDDGTVVYSTRRLFYSTDGDTWVFNGLFAVHPATPGALRAITPYYGDFFNQVTGIGEFDCE